MTDHSTAIVADGAKRLRATRSYATMQAQLLAEHTKRHESELRGASLFRRLWIEAKVRRTVKAELRKLFPPGCLHVALARR